MTGDPACGGVPVETSPVFRIVTGLELLPVVGSDTCIVTVPDAIFGPGPDGREAIMVGRLGRFLRGLSTPSEEDVGTVRLHHAEWVLTNDPRVVEAAYIHECPRCRAGVDQGLATLAEYPDRPLLVGLIYWADP